MLLLRRVRAVTAGAHLPSGGDAINHDEPRPVYESSRSLLMRAAAIALAFKGRARDTSIPAPCSRSHTQYHSRLASIATDSSSMSGAQPTLTTPLAAPLPRGM